MRCYYLPVYPPSYWWDICWYFLDCILIRMNEVIQDGHFGLLLWWYLALWWTELWFQVAQLGRGTEVGNAMTAMQDVFVAVVAHGGGGALPPSPCDSGQHWYFWHSESRVVGKQVMIEQNPVTAMGG